MDCIEEGLAKCIPLLQQSGLDYVVHDGGFTIDAEWNDAMCLIGKIHEFLHMEGYVRILSDMRVGTRTDKSQSMQDKIDTVEAKLKKGTT